MKRGLSWILLSLALSYTAHGDIAERSMEPWLDRWMISEAIADHVLTFRLSPVIPRDEKARWEDSPLGKTSQMAFSQILERDDRPMLESQSVMELIALPRREGRDPMAEAMTLVDPKGDMTDWMGVEKAEAPRCKISFRQMAIYAAWRRMEESQKASSPTESWPPQKRLCLAVGLLGASREARTSQGFDPLPELLALLGTDQKPMAQKALAIRYLKSRWYAESLRVLSEISTHDRKFRSIYRLVQTTYSASQRGSGDVAIKGM